MTNAEDAWAAAEEIGLPVVVKPQDGNQGRGVATNLTTREQVLAAYEAARKESGRCWSSSSLPGNDYRVLVVGGKLVAAARREPAQVVGDGVHTVAELVEMVNTRPPPRRGPCHRAEQDPPGRHLAGRAGRAGLTPAVDPAGRQRVLIRRNANLSTGGTAIDVTDLVHPEVAARCDRAAQVVGLDIAGVDVVAAEISRPLEEQGGVIVEVNAAPGCGCTWSLRPACRVPSAKPIVDTIFPPGDNGRIPIAAVTGVNGKTTTTRFIAHILRGTGRRVGMTCTDGIYIDDRRIDGGRLQRPAKRRNVLMNPGGRRRRAGNGPRRHAPRRTGLRPLRRGRGDQHRRRRPPRAVRTSTRLESWPRSSGRSSTWCAHGLRRAQRGRPAGGRDGRQVPGSVIFFARDPAQPRLAPAPRERRPGGLRPRRVDRDRRGSPRGGGRSRWTACP